MKATIDAIVEMDICFSPLRALQIFQQINLVNEFANLHLVPLSLLIINWIKHCAIFLAALLILIELNWQNLKWLFKDFRGII